jgi:hypothetical protein
MMTCEIFTPLSSVCLSLLFARINYCSPVSVCFTLLFTSFSVFYIIVHQFQCVLHYCVESGLMMCAFVCCLDQARGWLITTFSVNVMPLETSPASSFLNFYSRKWEHGGHVNFWGGATLQHRVLKRFMTQLSECTQRVSAALIQVNVNVSVTFGLIAITNEPIELGV